MSNRPRPSQSPERRPLTRRQLAAQQREANVQRRVILALGGAVGLALLLIVAGVLYDRLYLPSRTVKQVNNQTLSRTQYETVLRQNTIQQLAQALQFSKLFGAQQSFGQGGTFSQQILETNASINQIGTSRSRQQPIDENVVSQWVDQQLVSQNAQQQFGIEPSQGEIDQALVGQLGSLLQTAEAVTDTGTITDTTTTTDTAQLDATAAATPEASAEVTSSVPTTTPVPTATPLPEEATTKTDQIIGVLYDEYTNVLNSLPEEADEEQRTPQVSREELAQVLRAQYRDQVVRQRVQEALVAEVPANDPDPPFIRARHILLKVPPDPTTPPEPEATDTADATATAAPAESPMPSPTPSAEELEALFTERKAEADEIYEQVSADPEAFPDVARERSEDSSAAQGGDLGAFDRQGNPANAQAGQGGGFVPEFTDAAWALADNEISQPVRTQFGWHIIQRLPEDPQAKLERLRTEAFDEWLNQQRATATIVPAPTATATEIPPIVTEEPAASESPAEGAPEATTTP